MSARPDAIPAELLLTTPEGASVRIGDAITDDLTVIQLVRYFGCLPCQDWLVQLGLAAPQLAEHGIGATAIGGSADYQATWLREERGVAMPLYLDPEHKVRDAVDLNQALGLRMLNPKGAASYARSVGRGFKPQKITKDTVKAPGVLIVDRDLRIRWRYDGKRIGDYPDLSVVVGKALSSVAPMSGSDGPQ